MTNKQRAYLSSLAEGEEPSVEGLKKSVEEYYSTKNRIPKRTYADSLLDSQFETHYPDQFWGEERKHRFWLIKKQKNHWKNGFFLYNINIGSKG